MVLLTGSGRFTDEGDQVVLDLGKSVVVVHDEHVPLAGFAADDPQLCHVHVGHSHDEDAVACGVGWGGQTQLPSKRESGA